MGYPQHYSRDLPQRCMHLVDQLWPIVAKGEGAGEFGGPLTTTFLMSLAAPMLVLPFERIVLQANHDPRIPSYANDRDIDADLTARLKHDLPGRFDGKSFFQKGSWSVVETEEDYFNLADRLPDRITHELAQDQAFDRAASMDTLSLLAGLRNALSHGGVAYLDKNGQTTDGQVAMLAFVSARMKGDGDERRAVGLRIVRVSEEAFRDFLRGWVSWLSKRPAEIVGEH